MASFKSQKHLFFANSISKSKEHMKIRKFISSFESNVVSNATINDPSG